MKKTTLLQSTLMLLGVFLLIVILKPVSVSAARKDGTLKGSTIWTTQTTSAYNASGHYSTSIPKGKKLVATGGKSGRISVKYRNKTVYIDSTYVLINVKEFIPSLIIGLDMAYSNNLFNMGGEKIPGISNKRFYTSKASKNATACWLRYVVAKKLLNAQKSFKKDGYGIVIYDAYRPYSVTCKIRNAFRSFLNGKSSAFKSKWFGSLGESWFLAQGASAHNYGRAVDITLYSLTNIDDLEMPSVMHTLDKRAAYTSWQNDSGTSAKNARYMKKKMESAGFTYLLSEWWHFQDNGCPSGPVIDMKI